VREEKEKNNKKKRKRRAEIGISLDARRKQESASPTTTQPCPRPLRPWDAPTSAILFIYSSPTTTTTTKRGKNKRTRKKLGLFQPCGHLWKKPKTTISHLQHLLRPFSFSFQNISSSARRPAASGGQHFLHSILYYSRASFSFFKLNFLFFSFLKRRIHSLGYYTTPILELNLIVSACI
jgi:hypothetical protein